MPAAYRLYRVGASTYYRVADDGQSKVVVTNTTARSVDEYFSGPVIVADATLTTWLSSIPTNV